MTQFISLIRSIVSDTKHLRKPFINFTLAYIGLAVVSNVLSLFNSSNEALNSLIALLILTVAVLQTVAIVYFQQAYIKQQIGNVVFNSIFAEGFFIIWWYTSTMVFLGITNILAFCYTYSNCILFNSIIPYYVIFKNR